MANDASPARLSAAIVLYRSDPKILQQVVSALGQAARYASIEVVLWLVDNDTQGAAAALASRLPIDVRASFKAIELIEGQGNVGFGHGHNLAIERTNSDLHLVLNPDAILAEDGLAVALDFLDHNRDVVLVVPSVYNEHQQMQYLCRRYPNLFNLFLRGFAPRSVRQLFRSRLARYELRDLINDHEVYFDPLLVSGSFMLYRSSTLKEMGGFDSRYFLYFEDYDISLRTHRFGRIAYLPKMRIVHFGGDAAKKGIAHIRMFIASALRFFHQHGWSLF
jgi:GT2 family glycosyltransferase